MGGERKVFCLSFSHRSMFVTLFFLFPFTHSLDQLRYYLSQGRHWFVLLLPLRLLVYEETLPVTAALSLTALDCMRLYISPNLYFALQFVGVCALLFLSSSFVPKGSHCCRIRWHERPPRPVPH